MIDLEGFFVNNSSGNRTFILRCLHWNDFVKTYKKSKKINVPTYFKQIIRIFLCLETSFFRTWTKLLFLSQKQKLMHYWRYIIKKIHYSIARICSLFGVRPKKPFQKSIRKSLQTQKIFQKYIRTCYYIFLHAFIKIIEKKHIPRKNGL